jgi:dTDP-4-dehydrorhamnose reductase
MMDDSALQVINGQVIAPAYSADLAKTILEIISRGCEGTYHFCQEGAVTTADFFNRALDLLAGHGVTDKKYSVIGVEKEDFLAPGERPLYNVLDNGKLTRAAGINIRSWESALEDYISRNSRSIIQT